LKQFSAVGAYKLSVWQLRINCVAICENGTDLELPSTKLSSYLIFFHLS